MNHQSLDELDKTFNDSRITNNQKRQTLISYTLELLALAVWIGGLIIIVTAVIPAVFNSFAMEPGGRFLTRVFDGYNRLVLISSALLIQSAIYRTIFGRQESFRSRLSRAEWSVMIIMIVLAAMIIFVLEPSSVRLQEQAFAIKDEVDRKVAYESFFKFHNIVRALYIVNLGLAIALIPIKLKHWLTPRKVLS